MTRILGIETSCDETAAAVVDDQRLDSRLCFDPGHALLGPHDEHGRGVGIGLDGISGENGDAPAVGHGVPGPRIENVAVALATADHVPLPGPGSGDRDVAGFRQAELDARLAGLGGSRKRQARHSEQSSEQDPCPHGPQFRRPWKGCQTRGLGRPDGWDYMSPGV